MAKNASVITIFAEDIRDEVSGQFSLIGVFDDILEIAEAPTKIHNIELLVTISTHTADPFIMSSFRVFFDDGNTLMTHDFTEEMMDAQRKAMAEAALEDPSREWASARIRAGLRNIQIDGPGALCVEATDVNGSVARSNRLRITQKDIKSVTSILM